MRNQNVLAALLAAPGNGLPGWRSITSGDRTMAFDKRPDLGVPRFPSILYAGGPLTRRGAAARRIRVACRPRGAGLRLLATLQEDLRWLVLEHWGGRDPPAGPASGGA